MLVAVALLAALVAEIVVTVTTNFIPGGDDLYGAPIPVGRSCFDILFPRCATTFSGVLFTINVLVTWIGWFALARWAGLLGVLAAVVGVVVSVLLIPVMLGYELPLVGIPIPLGPRTPISNPHAIWLDTVIWAIAGAAIVRALRLERLRRPAS